MSDPGAPPDPGWAPVRRIFLRHLIMPWRLGRRPGGGDQHPLTVHRLLFVALLWAGPLILFVLTRIVPFGEPRPGVAMAVAGVALAGFTASGWAWRRPLTANDPSALAGAFRKQFFLSFVLTEAPMLIAFVVSMMIDEWWPFPIGLAEFLAGMSMIAPTRTNFERKDAELAARGAPVTLTAALVKDAEARRVPRDFSKF